MAPVRHGTAINAVNDAKAMYPLTVDPTWSDPAADVYVAGYDGVASVNPSTGVVGSHVAYAGVPFLDPSWREHGIPGDLSGSRLEFVHPTGEPGHRHCRFSRLYRNADRLATAIGTAARFGDN